MRRLPVPQPVRAGQRARVCEATSDGLAARRQLVELRRHRAGFQRHESRTRRRRGRRDGESSTECIRLPLSRRQGPALRRFRQRRPFRCGREPRMGPRQHRRLRRRPGQCHGLRPVGRRGQGRCADGLCSRAWTLSQGRDRKLLGWHSSGEPRGSRRAGASIRRAAGHPGSRPGEAAGRAHGPDDRRDEDDKRPVSSGRRRPGLHATSVRSGRASAIFRDAAPRR